MNPDFQLALAAELHPGEKVVWQAQPNADAIRGSLLSFSVLWLSGLFMLGAGVLRSAPDDPRVLYGLIGLLVVVAVTGVFEVIFVPRRASKTIYFLTDRRLVSLCVSRRMFNPQDEYASKEKTVLKESKNSLSFFYMSNLPGQMLFVLLAQDVCSKLVQHFDLFIAIGFGLTVFGWLQPWLLDMRLPLPKFRDAARIFYVSGNIFVFLESFNKEEIAELCFRSGRLHSTNVFVISKNGGCIRLRAIPEVDALKKSLKDLMPSLFQE